MRDTVFRSGFVALVGVPNVGKSTLLNHIMGEKIAIVTAKAQTTRTRMRGILNRENEQIVFVDTPGLCLGNTSLHRAMRTIGKDCAADSDITLVLLEPKRKGLSITDGDKELVEAARSGGGRVIVVLNKIDRLDSKSELLPWISQCIETLEVEHVMPISALHNDGVEDLLRILLEMLPEGVPLFPQDLHTDHAEIFLCEELIREQLLLQTQQEIPHSAAIVIEDFQDRRDSLETMKRRTEGPAPIGCRLEGRIYLERDSQKGIVVGKRGARIREISEHSRKSIETLLGCTVYLKLTVHVKKEWTRTQRGIEQFGFGVES